MTRISDAEVRDRARAAAEVAHGPAHIDRYVRSLGQLRAAVAEMLRDRDALNESAEASERRIDELRSRAEGSERRVRYLVGADSGGLEGWQRRLLADITALPRPDFEASWLRRLWRRVTGGR